jgi:hypothetical protein
MEISVNRESASGSPRWKLYVAVLLWVVAAVCAVSLFRELPWAANADYRDFNIYYSVANLLRHNISPYPKNHSWAWDTPSWFLCFESLTFLPRFAAYKLWFFVNLVAFAITLVLLLRDSALEETDKWILAALIVLYPPIATNFWFGQSEVFLLFLLVLFIRELQRGRDVTAGIILAAASLLRAYPVGLIGYLAARRKWKAVLYTVIGCIAGMIITAAFVGTDVVITYIMNVIESHSWNQPVLRYPNNLSLSWFVRFVLLQGFGIAELSTLSSSLALIAGMIAAAFAFVVTRRLDDDSDWSGFSLWVVTVSILSPIMLPQFMVCFVIVFVALAKGLASRRAVVAAGASYVILAAFCGLHGYPLNFLPEFAQSHFPKNIPILLAESVTVSLILLYVACCWFISDAKPPQSTRMGSMLASQADASRQVAS